MSIAGPSLDSQPTGTPRSRSGSPPESKLLARLERWQWLLPIAGFLVGWVGYIAIERGPALARGMALTALLGWLCLMLEQVAGRWLHRVSKGRLSPHLTGFITQSLQQELLFFSLAFAIGAAQLDVGHGIFLTVLGLAALVSTLDPIYHRHIAASPVMAVCFQVFCTWVTALVVLPIALHLPLEAAAPCAAVVALLTLVLGLPRLLSGCKGLSASLRAAVPVIAALILVTLLAAQLPPAGLRLTEARITQELSGLKPGAPVREVDVATLRQQGLIAFTAIHAPAGLRQGLSFDWYHGGICIDRIPAVIEGVSEKGRGWRTWTRKQNFDGDPRGRWHVDIRTTGGQLVGRLYFRVV